VKETREFNPPGDSRPAAARIPEEDFTLRLADLDHGRLEHVIPIDRHTDRVTLQAIDPEGPLEQTFEYTDTASGAADYYYVRVLQVDGSRAWSSPFWVGERTVTEN
jgi:hypothetical protein